MPSLFKPSAVALREFLACQSQLDFTYPEVGATARVLPLGEGRDEGALISSDVSCSTLSIPHSYTVDHTRVELGRGPDIFARAKAALAHWQQFRLSWLSAFPDDTPLRAGETVAVVARAGRLWWTNAARIVYTIDDEIGRVGEAGTSKLPLFLGQAWGEDALRATRFGFAYGTLPAHVESGEERFLIEWNRDTGQVSFDILAFSRPRHILVRLNRRRARAMQKRFAADAAEAMLKYLCDSVLSQ
jgi:uncharacterized protein (UPF0548 family)